VIWLAYGAGNKKPDHSNHFAMNRDDYRDAKRLDQKAQTASPNTTVSQRQTRRTFAHNIHTAPFSVESLQHSTPSITWQCRKMRQVFRLRFNSDKKQVADAKFRLLRRKSIQWHVKFCIINTAAGLFRILT